jgi:hypothetical protein
MRYSVGKRENESGKKGREKTRERRREHGEEKYFTKLKKVYLQISVNTEEEDEEKHGENESF